jgi:hypothetical protein
MAMAGLSGKVAVGAAVARAAATFRPPSEGSRG